MTPGERQRILIVDDNEAGRYAVGRVLRQAGYDIVEAGTGGEALSRVTADRPDLVILDVRLPDINGVEVSGQIKAKPETASIPVLQMSASAVDSGSRVAALESGADGYISSPVEPAVLVATVRALLRIRVAEQALQQSVLEWQTTFDAIRDGVVLLDAQGTIRRSNESLATLLQLDPPGLAGRRLDDLIPPAAEQAPLAEVLSGRQRASVERTLDERIFGITVDPMTDAAQQLCGGVAIVTDLTERKHVERRLWHAQKMESIGLLAGGVAHDFNNLLMGILGNASLALELLRPQHKARRAMQDVVRASERAADLTRQLLAYAGKGRFVVEHVDVNELIRDLVPLIQTSVPRKATLILDLASDLPGIEADKAQIEQVVMNLIINAAESIQDEAGKVTVATRVRHIEPAEGAQFLAEQEIGGNYLSLEVSDTGSGMDEETRQRIFDPFFSTKFLGRGLGLSAALGIVRGHKGAVRVTSTPGEGTTFEVLLPAGAAVKSVPAVGKPKPARGQGTILVVDDEEIIRRLMKETLERNGYAVLLAENGAEALGAFSRNANEISLVILDLVMPVMSGEEVLPHLFIMRPGVRVVVSSGQDVEQGMKKLGDPRVAGYLQKPYTPDRLLESVAEAMGKERAAGRET